MENTRPKEDVAVARVEELLKGGKLDIAVKDFFNSCLLPTYFDAPYLWAVKYYALMDKAKPTTVFQKTASRIVSENTKSQIAKCCLEYAKSDKKDQILDKIVDLSKTLP